MGGIGSGKSFVADLFARQGCLAIHADQQVQEAYRDRAVLGALRDWWGEGAFLATGEVNRKAIAAIIFSDPSERARLEHLLHPWIAQRRDELMSRTSGDISIRAYVWDTPLLAEVGLDRHCDALVFVESPRAVRLARLGQSRGWGEQELERRENLQWPLDRKREIAHYVVDNSADAEVVQHQVKNLLSRIINGIARCPVE